jgi:hypothetical protein
VTILESRCDHPVTAPQFAELGKGSLVITGSRGEPIRRQNVFLGMPNKRIRRYLIDIKDANGQSVFFTAADWSDEERRAAITQILRLDGVPDVYDFSEPKLKPKHGKE